jgi:salicylate hydroxylase
MGVEDGAVLGKLFSHLHTDSQISDFLYAFQELRQPHSEAVLAAETGIIHFMSMPDCEAQRARDQRMMAKTATGSNLFDIPNGEKESVEWAEIKNVFGYDAEDEADNWWVTWGLLKERSLVTRV